MINITAAWNKMLKKNPTTFFFGGDGTGRDTTVSNVLGGAKEQLAVHPYAFVVSVAAEYNWSPIVHLFNLVL